MADDPRYYIVVTSPDNWEKTASRGWSLLGLKSTRRRLAAQFKPGDRVVAYYTGLKQFGAVLKVTSECFEDHEPIWGSPNKPKEDYPFRVHTEPEIILAPGALIDAKDLAMRMAYTRKWPAENWTLAFQGNIHAIPAADFELIRAEMTAAVASR
ncbi:MAG TPA: EVE domain-containing protein [Dehalococcoidia bacterium]|jgi:predicted RNA-binding protein